MWSVSIDVARLGEVDRLAERELAETGLPGLAIGLTGPDGVPEVRTYGLADVDARRPVGPGTLFEIGSIGKTFTAIVILQLVDESRLDLDAPVADALPWFEVPVVGRPITIHDLLTHTAGLTVGIDATPEAAFQVWALRDRRPGSAPGERFHYSNLGYKALGLVVEAVDGRPYPEAVRARILEPLGMTATEPAITHRIRSRLAVGYSYVGDDRIGYPGQPIAPATWIETATADGSIASTAGDMVAFARMLLRGGEGPSGRVVSERSFARMAERHARTPRGNGYGYGLAALAFGGRSFLGHHGGMIGYLSALLVDPAAELAAVVLQNGCMGDPMALARAALAAVRGPEAGGGSASGARGSPADVAALPAPTGLYRAEADRSGIDAFEIITSPEGLKLRRDGRVLALEAMGEGRFLAHDPDLDRYAFRFEPAEERPIVAWHGPTRFVRDGMTAPALPAPEPAVAAAAGHYGSYNPWTTNFRVILRGDVPWLVFTDAPDGFEEEQCLVARPDGTFQVGDDPGGPEDIRFDTVIDGRPVRAWLSGCPYYRMD